MMLNCPGPPLFVHVIDITCTFTHYSVVNEAFAILAQHSRHFQICYGIRRLTGNHVRIAANTFAGVQQGLRQMHLTQAYL